MQASESMTAFSLAFMKAVTVMIVLPVYTYFRNYKITMWNFCSFIFSLVKNKKVADHLLSTFPVWWFKLLWLIVKPSLIWDAKTSYDLMQINLSDSKSLLKNSDVQIGFFVSREVQLIRKCDEITIDFVKVFKNGCLLILCWVKHLKNAS